MNLEAIWAFLTAYPAVLAALITFSLTIGWQLISRVFAARPRLVWGVTNQTHFLVPFTPAPTDAEPHPQQQTSSYYTRNIWLQNVGSAPAEEVEIVWNWKPQHMERYPHYPVTEQTQDDSRYVLTIARLNPREGVTFGLLSLNVVHPDITLLRCKGYAAKQVPFWNQRRYSNWILSIVALDMLLGLFAAIYLVILLGLWIV